MFQIFIKILPLLLGSTFAPVILGFAIFLLASKTSPLKKILFYLSGDILVVILYGLLGFLIGSGLFQLHNTDTQTTRIIDVVIGIIFIVLAFVFGFSKTKKEEKEVESKEKQKRGLLKWFSVGFIANFSNFDAVALYITANKEVYQSTILIEEKVILSLIHKPCSERI